MQRRQFVKSAGLIATGLGFLPSPPLWAMDELDVTKVVILHTNDVHSRIEPFPMDGSKQQGRGGAARRASLIESVRAKEPHVLLFDSGDMFQGTPYFNFFGGELEVKLMSQMRYDAGTIGNHDFDGGMENLTKQMKHATFPLLNANYGVQNTPLRGITQDYKVFKKGNVKIGVFGVGIELDGLVPKALYGDTQYNDPISVANRIASVLKNEEDCDFVVCLSHLGFKYPDGEKKISDITLASQSDSIDLILGAHTHTFLNTPEKVKNKAGKLVSISQVGWAGMVLGRLDIYFENNKKDKCITCKNVPL
jgi:5'-nucleotidase